MANLIGKYNFGNNEDYSQYYPLLASYQRKAIQKAEKQKTGRTPFWQKIISVLSSGETGETAMRLLEGKNPIKSYADSILEGVSGQGYDHRTYKDVLEKLGMKRKKISEIIPWAFNETGKGIKFQKDGIMDVSNTGTIGTILDIGLDPTTYFSFGLTKAAKLRALTKNGDELLQSFMKPAAKQYNKLFKAGKVDEAIKFFDGAKEQAAKALAKNPEKNFKGLTWMGKEIIPRKTFANAGRLLDKTMMHVPVLNSAYRFARNGIQDMFVYGADLIRQGKTLGDAAAVKVSSYLDMKKGIYRYTENANNKLLKDLGVFDRMYGKLVGKARKDFDNKVLDVIEGQLDVLGIEKIDATGLKRITDALIDANKAFFNGEKDAYEKLGKGIYNELSGYMPHNLTREARQALQTKNAKNIRLQSGINWSTKSEKPRNMFKLVSEDGKEIKGNPEFYGLKEIEKDGDRMFKDSTGKIYKAERTLTINEINDELKGFMKDAGFEGKNFLETDPLKLVLQRGAESSKKIANLNFLNQVSGEFGKWKNQFVGRNIDDAGITYVEHGIKELPDDLLLPDFIVKDIKRAKEVLADDNALGNILKAYDTALGKFKYLVYGWYPASHGRNLISGLFNDTLGNAKSLKYVGQPVLDVVKGSDKTIKLGGKEYTYAMLKKKVAEYSLLGSNSPLDVADLNKTFNRTTWQKIKGTPTKAMDFVEQNVRIPLFLAEIDSGKSFKEAANTVFKYHFEYTPASLTKFEQSVMKRVIPFYTWTRRNIPLMMEQMIEQPAKMNSFFRVLEAATDKDGKEHSEFLPEYMDADFPVMSGGKVFSNFGMPPLEMLKYLQSPVKQITQSMSPLLKIPIELRTNFSMFRNSAITEDTSGKFAKNYPEAVKNWLEFQDKSYIDEKTKKKIEYYTVNPLKKYWIYSLPSGRLNTVISTLLDEKTANQITRQLLGISSYEQDKNELRSAYEKRVQKRIDTILKESGIISAYGTPYKFTKEKLKALQEE